MVVRSLYDNRALTVFRRILSVALSSALQPQPWKRSFLANFNSMGVFLVENKYPTTLFQEDGMSIINTHIF